MSGVGEHGLQSAPARRHHAQRAPKGEGGIFDVVGAAQALCCCRASIYRLVHRGELPIRRDPFGRLRFYQSDLDHVIRLQRPAVTA